MAKLVRTECMARRIRSRKALLSQMFDAVAANGDRHKTEM